MRDMHLKLKLASILSLIAATSVSALQGCVPLVLAGTGAAALTVDAANSELSIGTQIDDKSIGMKSAEVLKTFPELKHHSNVEVAVFNNVVLLVGQVPNQRVQHGIAVKIAALPLVKKVYNQLTVGEPISFNTYSSDAMITTKVKSQMLGKVNPGHFKVITENGVVYLMAFTNQEEGDTAAEITSHVPGVTKVVKVYELVDTARGSL
jgi:osmotically-inducible protein OsmY